MKRGILCATIGLFLAAIGAAANAGAAGAATQSALPGTWIGWGWLGEAGDLPLRFDFRADGDSLVASFGSPAHKLREHPVTTVTWRPPTMQMTLTSPGGSAISLDLKQEGDVFSGSLRWGEYQGTAELVRSPLPVFSIDPASYADAAGFYERSRGDVIELWPRKWGEMLYRERRTGRLRTLLPLDRDRFFLGSAVYVPGPVEAKIRLVRDSSGGVTGLVETLPDGSERTAHRLHSRTEDVVFRSGGAELHGTMLIPEGGGPHPGVVMTGGSSWETRDDVMFQARGLAALGFVVLAYDKRGFGASSGETIVPFDTTARDAVAGVEMLRRRPEVSNHTVGVFGMSRGGWYAPLAASLSNAVGFLILLVPPAVTPADQETSRRLASIAEHGGSEADLELGRQLLHATWRWVREGEGWDAYRALRAQAVNRGFPEDVLSPDSPDSAEWAWARHNMFFDPCPVLARVHVPVIALFGGADTVVDPAVNRPLLERCLARGGNRNVTVRTLPGARHNLGVPGDVPTHRYPGSGDEGFRALADWALEQFP